MIFPTVHTNGTSRDELVRQHTRMAGAVADALDVMAQNGPNARDYYPQGEVAHLAAYNAHRDRMDRLRGVKAELMSIAEHVANVAAR